MVLKDQTIGEFDKRISILTLEKGRISAFLKGAKRAKGSPLSSIGPFSFGKFATFEGRSSYTVKTVEISERFEKIQGDLTNIAYGAYFLEVAEYYSRENADENERLKLLYQSLRALESKKFDPEFVRLVYELKNIAIMGEYPNIFNCKECNGNEELTFFSFDQRIAYCKKHGEGIKGLYKMSSALSYSLWFIFTTPVEKLYSFRLSEKASKELRSFADKYKKRYINHPFKTYEMISVLTS